MSDDSDSTADRPVEILDQPAPTPRPDLPTSWELVIADVEVRYPLAIPWMQTDELIGRVVADMRDRDRVGRERYGTPLTSYNGRDSIVDLYQELLDAAVYARTAITEGSLGFVGIYHSLLDHVMNVRAHIEARDAARRGA